MGHIESFGKWKMQIVDVKVNDVEGRSALEHLFELKHVISERHLTIRIQAQRGFTWRNQSASSRRIAACEERQLMALFDQFLGQIGNNPFSPAVVKRRNSFVERRYLCNFHNAYHTPISWLRLVLATATQTESFHDRLVPSRSTKT